MSDSTITRDNFNATVAAIAKSGAAYSRGIGRALLGALYFSIAEQDPKPANDLVGALRKSTKQQAVIDILEDNGNLAWTKIGKKTPSFEFFEAMHTWMPEDVEELRKVCENWEAYKRAPAAKEYDAIKAVEQIIKNIEAKERKGQRVIGAHIKQGLVEALAKNAIAIYGEAV